MEEPRKILVTAPYFVPVVDEYRQRFAENGYDIEVLHVRERAEEEDLLPAMENVVGVICGDDRFTARVIDSSPSLQVLAKWGTGIDSLDQEACSRRGVTICRTLDAFSHPVADTVLAYILAFCRNVVTMDRAMKRGIWKKIDGVALRECTVGVVGVGNCGKQVGRRVSAFGATLVGNDTRPIAREYLQETGMEAVGLDELLGRSDFVSINTDLNPTSYHLINAETLSRMKRSAVLINTARGPVVHEKSLCDALAKGHIAGAALDVFEDEPIPADSPLLHMDQVFIAPHNANSSPQAWNRVHESTVSQLLAALKRNA